MTEQWYAQIIKRVRFVVDLWLFSQHYKKIKAIQQCFYNVFAEYLVERWLKCERYYQMYDSYADPLTLNMEEVIQRYLAKKRRQLYLGKK